MKIKLSFQNQNIEKFMKLPLRMGRHELPSLLDKPRRNYWTTKGKEMHEKGTGSTGRNCRNGRWGFHSSGHQIATRNRNGCANYGQPNVAHEQIAVI